MIALLSYLYLNDNIDREAGGDIDLLRREFMWSVVIHMNQGKVQSDFEALVQEDGQFADDFAGGI